jgi:hypothetical protein
MDYQKTLAHVQDAENHLRQAQETLERLHMIEHQTLAHLRDILVRIELSVIKQKDKFGER